MKFKFKALLVLALMAGLIWPAYETWAGYNIRQNPDGTTDFVRNGVDGAAEEVPVGVIHLSAFFSDVTLPLTRYIVVPTTGGRVSQIVGVIEGQIATANQPVRFWHMDTAGNVQGEITDGSSQMTFSSGGVTGVSKLFTASSATVNNITKQHVIAISTDGASTGTVPASFVITLEPR